MARHGTLSRRPAKEQPPADMRDDKTANTTTSDHTHIPLPSSTPSIPSPVSDCCATAVPVGVLRRSAPDISRFCPVLGWRCYDGVIVTCYNQVTRHGRKRKGEKNILLFFLLFVEEDSFLPLEQRVELRIDLAGTTTLWKNQDVT